MVGDGLKAFSGCGFISWFLRLFVTSVDARDSVGSLPNNGVILIVLNLFLETL